MTITKKLTRIWRDTPKDYADAVKRFDVGADTPLLRKYLLSRKLIENSPDGFRLSELGLYYLPLTHGKGDN